MNKQWTDLFEKLVTVSSPSGFEQGAQEIYRNYVKPFADEVKTDVHGNVIALKKGTGDLRFMVVGHADEIGLMIHYIEDNGFLRFSAIGGVDVSLLPGTRVNVYHEGTMLRGVIGKKPIHLLTPDERTKAAKLEDLFIDIGAKDKEDALTKVALGDYATFSPGMEMLNDHLVTTKATDNKVGVLIAAALQEILKDETLAASLYSVASVQEEIGLRGAITSAFGIDPHVGIAIDVTHATDYPTINKSKFGDITCGGGPVLALGADINPMVFKLLKQAAENADVAYQIEAAPRGTGTDANAIQTTRAGVAAGLISIPCRYMHTQNEVISLNDVDGAVKIIAEFLHLIDDSTDFIPSV